MLIDNCPKEFNANLMEESEFDRDNKRYDTHNSKISLRLFQQKC